jgi:hypothetical protein
MFRPPCGHLQGGKKRIQSQLQCVGINPQLKVLILLVQFAVERISYGQA